MNGPARSLQWIVWGGMAVTMAVILAALVLQNRRARSVSASTSDAPEFSESGLAARGPLPVLFRVPDFALTNQDGQRITLDSLRAQVWLADIIFTRCSGPCPAMARRTAELQGLINPQWPVKFVTLTTDPDYDTPAVLRAHGQRYGAQSGRWHFLTGPKKEVVQLAVHGLKLTALDKDPGQQETPTDLFIHSTQFILVDGQGQARAVFENEDAEMPGKVMKALQRLLTEK
jgi:protein SCO1/2